MENKRWIRIWFENGTVTEVEWYEIEEVRSAYAAYKLKGENSILELDACNGGTIVFAASAIESYCIMDMEDWKRGLEHEAELEKLRLDTFGRWE
jgi:hypothetical protein